MRQALKLAVTILAMGLAAPALCAQQAETVRPVEIEIKRLNSEWARLAAAGQAEAALAVVLKTLPLAEEADGPHSDRVGHYLLRAGALYLQTGQRVRAEAAYARALAIFEREYGQRLPAWGCYIPAYLAKLNNNLLAELDAKIANYERAVACYEATPKPGNAISADAAFELAYYYRYRRERHDLVAKATPLLDRWIPIVERDLGPDRYELAKLLRARAEIYAANGDTATERTLRLRALDVLSRGPGPAKGEQDKLEEEGNQLLALMNKYRGRNLDETYVDYQARYLAVMERTKGPTSSFATSAREELARLREQFPNWRPASEAAPVRQAAAPPNPPRPAPESGGGGRVVQAAGQAGKPVWPVGMETGNLYFVISSNTDGTYTQEDVVPIMVAAQSAPEAVERVRRAHLQWLPQSYQGRAVHARLIEAGECKGPAWGAVVTGSVVTQKRFVWGGGCGKTPAQAIEAAFAACRKHGPLNCDTNGTEWLEITLALSGRSSWSGKYCFSNCIPGARNNFGSFNAFTQGPYEISPIEGMADAIAKLGKACRNQPCYLTTPSVRCFDEAAPDVRVAKCTDTRLTPEGYPGPIRRDPER